MSRRKARLTESIQQLNDTTIAQAHGLANIQEVKAGSQDFDSDADLILMTLSVPATVLLPSVALAVDSYVYTIRNLGTADLSITPSGSDLIDQTASTLVVSPGVTRTITAVLRDSGIQEWVTFAAGGSVTSVFGRSGDIAAADGDYTFAQIGGDIEGSDTGNTDTNRVLAPDGSGGVQWRDDPTGTTTVNTAADFGTAVGGVITLITGHVYNINAIIDLGTDTMEGINVVFIGDSSPGTLVTTDSSDPLIASTGSGYINILDGAFQNIGGPIFHVDLGVTPFSIFRINQTILLGGKTAGGSGSLGTIVSTERVTISGSFFVDMENGILVTGKVNEISITDVAIGSGLGATAFKAIEVANTADLDIVRFSNMRFSTANAADRCVKLGTSATYASPVHLDSSTIRGLGTIVDAAGLSKSDPFFITENNEGATAPTDSLFTGTATYKNNTDVTVIASIGAQVRIGNGTVGHTLWNGGSFLERFTLTGAQTQLQELTYIGISTRTFEIQLNCQLNRVGGGTVIVGLAIQVNNVTIADSEDETEVSNTSSPGFAETTVELNTGDRVQLVICNETSTANLIVNSATWTIRRLN